MTNPKTAEWYMPGVEAKIDTLVAGQAAAIGGLAAYAETKAVTFNNTDADVTLFTVTGDVIVRVIAICKTAVASAGGCNISVGIAGATAAIIALTDCTQLAQNEIWHDASPDSLIEAMSIAGAAGFIISGGSDIVLDVEAAKQVDSGAVTFYCLWTPLSADGDVTAA